jgi:hypothetical protein
MTKSEHADVSANLSFLRSKIAAYLDKAKLDYQVGADGHYALREGTAAILIFPIIWRNHTLVQVCSPLAQDVDVAKLDSDFVLFLAEQNSCLMFGKFSLDTTQRTIWFEHVLLGDFLDADELLVALEMVALTADQYDEHIAHRSGGKRAIDKAQEFQQKKRIDIIQGDYHE